MKRVLLLYKSDNGANSERFRQLVSLLSNKSELYTIDVNNIFPLPFIEKKWMYQECFLATIIFRFYKIAFRKHPQLIELILRRKLLKKIILNNRPDTIICSSNEDAAVLLDLPRSITKIYDAANIFHLEIHDSFHYSNNAKKYIKKHEKMILTSQYIHTCFQWYTYYNFAKKLNIPIANKLPLYFDLKQKFNQFAKWSRHPKVIYLGKLNSHWVCPKKIESFQKKYGLDIFSYENPDKKMYSNLKIKGYLKDLNILCTYHYGLITNDDSLQRSYSFSAKHLKYLEYGLPVIYLGRLNDKTLKPTTASGFVDKKKWHKIQNNIQKLPTLNRKNSKKFIKICCQHT